MGTLTLQAYVAQVQSLVHDFTQSAWSLAEVISRINDARKDVSLDFQCVRSLKTGVQLLTNQEIYNYNGAVCGATVTSGGSNYGTGSTVPITFSAAPTGGVTAAGIGNLTGGALTSITMTQWGQGYTSVPTIAVGGIGSGAAATPVTMINTINLMSISPIWNTMRYTLSFKGFSIFQAWARMLQSQGYTSQPGIWTIHQGDQLVYIDPPPNQIYLSEWDTISLASPLVNITDVDTQIPDPWAEVVQFKAAAYLLMKHQNFGQAEYYERKYAQKVPQTVAGAGGVRIANPYNKSAQMKMRRA
jgi:hypothetical protein